MWRNLVLFSECLALKIQTDAYPQELSYEIKQNGIIINQGDGKNWWEKSIFDTDCIYVLEMGCVEILIMDEFGDGFYYDPRFNIFFFYFFFCFLSFSINRFVVLL